MAVTTRDGYVAILDGGNGRTLAHWKAIDGPVHVAAFTPSDAAIATGGEGGMLSLWTLQGRQLRSIHAHDNYLHDILMLPTHGTMLTAGGDMRVAAWRIGKPTPDGGVP